MTIQAPRGTSDRLAPYAPVTDAHGVDVYPVTLSNPAPNLHDVGVWTSTLAGRDAEPLRLVDAAGMRERKCRRERPLRPADPGQERFMIYDAIINGARNLAFYGGNNPTAGTRATTACSGTGPSGTPCCKGLIQEVSAISPVAPALVNAGTNASSRRATRRRRRSAGPAPAATALGLRGAQRLGLAGGDGDGLPTT